MLKKNNIFSDQFFKKKDFNTYTDIQKHYIIKELLVNGYTKKYIWYKYTGRKFENGKLKKWMVKLGYIDDSKEKNFFLKQKLTGSKSNSSYVSNTIKVLFKINKNLVLKVDSLKEKIKKEIIIINNKKNGKNRN